MVKKVKIKELKPKIKIIREIDSDEGSVEQDVEKGFSDDGTHEEIVSSSVRINFSPSAIEQDVGVRAGREVLSRTGAGGGVSKEESSREFYESVRSSAGSARNEKKIYVGGQETRAEAKASAVGLNNNFGLQQKRIIESNVTGLRRSDVEESENKYYSVEDRQAVEKQRRERRRMPWE